MRAKGIWLSVPASILAAVVSLAASGAESKLRSPIFGQWPAPEGARVMLFLDKAQYFLGENVLVHYCVENVGTKPFQISMGADHRGSIRRTRFTVAATDEDGKPVEDPEPPRLILYYGGPMWEPTLQPGDQFYAAVPLVDYLRFDGPGVYMVRVSHDLGWQETKERKTPVAEAQLKLLMPTEEEARRVVEEMYRLVENRPGIFDEREGKRLAPWDDFSALRYPIYLPILMERARKGCELALEGIAYIPSQEATKALVELLDHKDREFAFAAARSVEMRLPEPERRERYVYQGDLRAHRQRLALAWRPELAPRVRAFAGELLNAQEAEKLTLGAALLDGVGEGADLPTVVRALDRVLPNLEPRQNVDEWLGPFAADFDPPREACNHLVAAASRLVERGGDLPPAPRSAGEAVVFLRGLHLRDGFRPKGWQEECQRLLRHKVAYIRTLTLVSLFEPLEKPFIQMLPELLLDPALEVQQEACNAARKAKAPELRAPVLKLLASTGSPGLLSEALYAAFDLGARFEALLTIASRLDEAAIGRGCLWHLVDAVLEKRGATYVEDQIDPVVARHLKARWTAFLRDHREAVEAGRRLQPGGPDITPDLLPPGFSICITDDKRWP